MFQKALLLCLALFPVVLWGQLTLEGVWEGTLMVGGIHSRSGYPIEMHIQRRGKTITGRVIIYPNKHRKVETSFQGRLYDDLSIYLDETLFLPQSGDPYEPPFLRKYQLSWHRSLEGSSLNGFWQEITPKVFEGKRERGRIYLKKSGVIKP
ncbi:MAG: hypothetical protein R2795_18325 [Saprospiraceae bacterium]